MRESLRSRLLENQFSEKIRDSDIDLEEFEALCVILEEIETEWGSAPTVGRPEVAALFDIYSTTVWAAQRIRRFGPEEKADSVDELCLRLQFLIEQALLPQESEDPR